MPAPVIIVTQGLSVTTGVPNLDVVTGTAVVFTLSAPFTTYQWQLISVPVSHSLVVSSDALVPPLNVATVTITPTAKGTYKVRFIADDGIGVNKIAEIWFYARNPGDPLIAPTATFPRRHTAYTEGAESGPRGAMTELDAWMFVTEDIWKVVLDPSNGAGGDLSGALNAATVIRLQGRTLDGTAPGSNQVLAWDGSKWTPTTLNLTLTGDVTGFIGSNTVVKLQNRALNAAAPSTGNFIKWDGSQWLPASVPLVPATYVFPGVSGAQSVSGVGSNTYRGIGCVTFDPSSIAAGGGTTGVTRTVKFRAVLEGVSGVTAQVKLFNIDDGEDVTGTALSVASTTPSRQISGSLTVGAAAGNVKNALKTYEVQLQVLTPSPAGGGDGCTCKLAQLEVSYA